MKRTFLQILSLAVPALGLCGDALAVAPTVVRVGVSPNEPLAIVKSGGLVVEGLFPEIVEAVAAQRGWKVVYIPDTPASNMARLENGTLDLAFPVGRAGLKAAVFAPAKKSLFSSWGQVYALPGTPIRSLEHLGGRTVAVLRGSVHYHNLSAALNQAGISCEFVEMNESRQVFDAVLKQHVDAGLADRLYGETEAAGRGLRPTEIATAPVEFCFVALRSSYEMVAGPIDQWIAQNESDASSPYGRALRRWTQHVHYLRILGTGAAAVAIAALFVAGVAMVLRRVRRSLSDQNRRLLAENTELNRQLKEEHIREQGIESWEKWYKQLFNNTEAVVLVHGVTADGLPGKLVEANDTACLVLGYSRQELMLMSVQDVEAAPEAGKPPYAALIRKSPTLRTARDGVVSGLTTADSVSYERVYRAKSGAEIPMDVTARIFVHQGRLVVMVSALNITRRREFQHALQESQRRFQDFFTRSPIGIALYDSARGLTEVNQSCLAMFGCSERGQFARIDPFTMPELSEEDRRTLLKGGTVQAEITVDFDDLKARLRVPTTRGGRGHFAAILTNLGLDQKFEPKGFLLQIEDVTEARRADEALRQSERMLRQAQKMEAIGTLAGGIAHDFNNILTPIMGYTEMALLASPPESPVREQLDQVLKASHRAKALVRQILTFSRQTEHEEKPLRLIPIINEVLKLIRASIPPTIELRSDIQTDEDIVRADATQIHQVLMNLCTNAVHAMREKGGTLEIRLRKIAVDSRTRGVLARLKPGFYGEITVRDTGTGMDRATLDRIFEPFFTTKRHGEGTGMGLAVAHGIVTALRGSITVESELGKGTQFAVVLPLVEGIGVDKAEAGEPLPLGRERILVVDDEPGICEMVSQMLSGLGYAPTTCQRSPEALTLFRNNPDGFDALITDQMMPIMTGIELIREVRKLRSALPVVMLTGFGKMVAESELREAGVREMVMKPIVLRQLADALSNALSRARRQGTGEPLES